MAKKAGKQSGDFGGYQFLSVGLDKADKEWLASANLPKELPLVGIIDLVQEGYKFSINEDANNSSYVASLTDKRTDSPTFKHILTGRGSTPLDAWYALAYKHLYKCQGDWLPYVNSADTSSDKWG